MGKTGFTVTTWANGYGRWHAKVKVPNMACMGPVVQRAARKAIIAELDARDLGHTNVGVRFVGIENGQVHYEEVALNER